LFQTFKLFNRFAQFKPSALFASRRYCFALSFRAEGEKSFPYSPFMQDLSLPLEMTNCSHHGSVSCAGKISATAR